MNACTTLAQLSDVHLAPVPRLPWRYATAKRILGSLNWQIKRRARQSNGAVQLLLDDLKRFEPDHIAVTGDLVNLGLPIEYQSALKWLETVGPPADVSVIPGNHDIYSRLFGDIGVERWAEYMRGDAGDVADDRSLGAFDGPVDFGSAFRFPYVRRRGDVVLIGINSAVETRPFDATGSVAPDVLARLRTMLLDFGRGGLCRCVMIHHPPLPGLAKKRRALRTADRFADVLGEAGVELVIHGHNHRNSFAWGGLGKYRFPVIGVASASNVYAQPNNHMSQDKSLARYNLYKFSRTASDAAGTHAAWTIDVIGRGLSEPQGDVVELERYSIVNGKRDGTPPDVDGTMRD